MIADRDPARWRWTFRFAQAVVRTALKILYRIKAEGLEHVPKTGGVIIACNHSSYADPPAVGCVIPREVAFFAKKELFENYFCGAYLRWANSMPVDRTNEGARALLELIRRLQEGWAFILFPEGTRTKTGAPGEPKSGVGMAAVNAGVPIVPCYIEGSFRPKWFRSRITIHYLPAFRPDEIEAPSKKEHYLLVSKRIMCDINRLYESQSARREEAESHEL